MNQEFSGAHPRRHTQSKNEPEIDAPVATQTGPIRHGWDEARKSIAEARSRQSGRRPSYPGAVKTITKSEKDLVLRARLVENLTPSQRDVLEWLAQYADKDHLAWPSAERLMTLTELSRATLYRCLGSLETRGHIERNPDDVEEHPGAAKGYVTNVYRLLLDDVSIDATGVRPVVTWARRVEGLLNSERAVLVALSERSNARLVVFAKSSELAKTTGLSARTLTTVLGKLVARKLIKEDRGTGRRGTYKVLGPNKLPVNKRSVRVLEQHLIRLTELRLPANISPGVSGYDYSDSGGFRGLLASGTSAAVLRWSLEAMFFSSASLGWLEFSDPTDTGWARFLEYWHQRRGDLPRCAEADIKLQTEWDRWLKGPQGATNHPSRLGPGPDAILRYFEYHLKSKIPNASQDFAVLEAKLQIQDWLDGELDQDDLDSEIMDFFHCYSQSSPTGDPWSSFCLRIATHIEEMGGHLASPTSEQSISSPIHSVTNNAREQGTAGSVERSCPDDQADVDQQSIEEAGLGTHHEPLGFIDSGVVSRVDDYTEDGDSDLVQADANGGPAAQGQPCQAQGFSGSQLSRVGEIDEFYHEVEECDDETEEADFDWEPSRAKWAAKEEHDQIKLMEAHHRMMC